MIVPLIDVPLKVRNVHMADVELTKKKVEICTIYLILWPWRRALKSGSSVELSLSFDDDGFVATWR
jgi:hypothetical protein